MNLDELEAQAREEASDATVEVEWNGTDKADKSAKTEHSKKVKACTDKVFKCLFGKNHQNLSGKERVAKILAKAFDPEDSVEVEEDLAEALNLLDDNLILLERILARHPHLMGIDMVNQMEEVAEFISQWGLKHDGGDEKT